MRMTLGLAAVVLACACGKKPETAKPEAPAPPAAVQAPAPAADDSPLFSLDSEEPVIPDAPDHTQAHPGPNDALRADRAGLTTGKLDKKVRLEWESAPAVEGKQRIWLKSAVVTYRMGIAIFVSSNLKEGTCPYRVTWDHELSHANAYLSIFDASKVHLLASLEHSQEIEPAAPTKDAPAWLAPDEAAEFEGKVGEKIREVVEDQGRVVDTLMADHKRDRDSPEAYKIDTEKCPMADWQALRGGS